MRPVIFKEAGNIGMWQYAADGTVDPTSASTFFGANGTVESIKPVVEFKTQEVPDGNSLFPMGEYDVGIAGSVEVKFNSFQKKLFAALIGGSMTAESSQAMWDVEVDKTVPAASPYTVTLPHSVLVGGTIIVVDNAGSPLVSTGGALSAGNFSVSGATLTFNSTEAGAQVFTTYQHTVTDAEKVDVDDVVRRPFYAVIDGDVLSEDETATKHTNIIIDKCKAVGSITPPSQQRNKEGWTVNLKVIKPRSGNKAVTFRNEK